MDYHGEVGVIIENIDNSIKAADMNENGELVAPVFGSSFTIGKGERCAQMRLVEVPMINWVEVKSIGNFENDHGAGFGSTGKN